MVPSAAVLRARVGDLARETARIRGLAFTRDVPVRVETPAQIAAHLREELREDGDELAEERRLGVALGVLPRGIDLIDTLARLVGTEAQGYYDPSERVLVLTEEDAAALGSAGRDGIDARATVVHELTHALQHQHFAAQVDERGARSPALSDAARARLALLEGDATLVGMEYAACRRGRCVLGTPELATRLARWAEGAQVLTEVDAPPYLIESAEVPYEAGALAVGALHAAGGFARVDALLRAGVSRAAELLHPERGATVAYPEVPPPDPPAGAAALPRVLARSLGEIELRLFLARVMRQERAASLAAAWRGDAVALYDGGAAGDVVVWRVRCADGPSARAVADALAPMASRWRREGCPEVRGGRGARCPAAITVEDDAVVIARGE